ncbi:MAG: hypothetical protein QM756_40170 [Polyangiaceae bacterium]
MTPLQRLRETSTDEAELAVLSASDADSPTPDALAKTAAALGLPPELLLPATPAAPGLLGAAAKALLLGMALGGAGIGLVQVSTSALTPSAPSSASRSVAADPVAPIVPSSQREAPPAAPEVFARQPAAERARPARALASSAQDDREPLPIAPPSLAPQPDVPNSAGFPESGPTPSPNPSSPLPQAASIAEQIRLVDEARRLLARARAAQALQVVDAYRARWPGGAFSLEISVLSIEANLRLGRRQLAEREAAALFRLGRTGKYAERARALLAQ